MQSLQRTINLYKNYKDLECICYCIQTARQLAWGGGQAVPGGPGGTHRAEARRWLRLVGQEQHIQQLRLFPKSTEMSACSLCYVKGTLFSPGAPQEEHEVTGAHGSVPGLVLGFPPCQRGRGRLALCQGKRGWAELAAANLQGFWKRGPGRWLQGMGRRWLLA